MTKKLNNRKPKIAPQLLNKYTTWAHNKLSQFDSKLSYTWKWLVYGTISLCLLCLIIWNITRSFYRNYTPPEIGSINNEQTTKLDPIDPYKLKAIKMEKFLNRLKEKPGGQQIYDSIRQSRPGLFDSIKYYKNR